MTAPVHPAEQDRWSRSLGPVTVALDASLSVVVHVQHSIGTTTWTVTDVQAFTDALWDAVRARHDIEDPEQPVLQDPWTPPETTQVRTLAQDMVEQLGWTALDDRQRIADWAESRGLLSPLATPDHRSDAHTLDAIEARMRWLLEE